MKYFITATAYASVHAILLPFATASPTINARQSGVCDFTGAIVTGEVNVFSIKSQTTSDNLTLNFFGVAADNVASNQLGVFNQPNATPDPNAEFDLLTSRVDASDSFRFIIQQQSNSQEIALNTDNTTFSSAAANKGTEFYIRCDHCIKGPDASLNPNPGNGTIFAQDCSLEMPTGSAQKGCLTVSNSGSSGPVQLTACDLTQTTQQWSFLLQKFV